MSEVVRVLYDYVPSNQTNALKLVAGEIVRLIERSDDGWCLGTLGNVHTGRSGWFPAAYVSVISGVQLQAGEYVDESIRAIQSSQEDQKLYYTNIKTKETSWEIPVAKVQPQERRAIAGTNSTETICEPAFMRKKSGSSESQKKKTIVYTHHSVTFGVDEDSQSQSLLSPERMSYVDYFWSDKGDETGMDILVGHHIKGKLAMKDIAHFVRERAALEEAHARSLSKLANTTFSVADHCEGTIEDAWCCLKKTLLEEAEYRLTFAEKLLHEVEQPILKFKDGQKKERKSFASLLAEDRKQLASKYSAVQKSRTSVTVKHRELSTKSAVSKDLGDEKTQSEIRKAKRRSLNAEEDLKATVVSYNDMQNKWVDDMTKACKVFERAENDKVDVLKMKLGKYEELLRIVNVSCIKSCDKMLGTVQAIDPKKDQEQFIRSSATGSKRPTDLQY